MSYVFRTSPEESDVQIEEHWAKKNFELHIRVMMFLMIVFDEAYDPGIEKDEFFERAESCIKYESEEFKSSYSRDLLEEFFASQWEKAYDEKCVESLSAVYLSGKSVGKAQRRGL